MNAQQRIDALRDKQVAIRFKRRWVGEGAERHEVEVPERVTGVGLFDVLSPAQWCAMAMSDGCYYLGGCCGQLSAAQGYLNAAMRASGWFDAEDLLRFGFLLGTHDGFEEDFAELSDDQFAERLESWEQLEPWTKIGTIFKVVEPFLTPGADDLPEPVSESDERDFAVLRNTLWAMRWGDVFVRDDERHRALYEHTRLVRLARLLTPLRKTLAALEANTEHFEGYALVAPGTEQVLHNSYGLCLYGSLLEAQEMIELWERAAREDEQARPVAAEIVRASVSLADGLRILR